MFRSVPWILSSALGCMTLLGCADPEEQGAVFIPADGAISGGVSPACNGSEPPVGVLRGPVYSIPLETRELPDFGGMRPLGTLCMEHLAVTERRGYPGFPGLRSRFEWFAIDFQGSFVVSAPGDFRFRLTSDDGSKLFIDGAQVIENDGFHVTRAREGAVRLAAGTHGIAVPYWQGPGPMTLILEVARPGAGYEVFRAGLPLEGVGP